MPRALKKTVGPPESSTHGDRAAAERSSEWGRGMDALTALLTCLNNTVSALVSAGSAFFGSPLITTTSVTLCLCPSVGTP